MWAKERETIKVTFLTKQDVGKKNGKRMGVQEKKSKDRRKHKLVTPNVKEKSDRATQQGADPPKTI